MSVIAFLIPSIFAAILSAVIIGPIGSIIVAKRISYLAGGISHSILAGIGGAIFLNHHYPSLQIDIITGGLIAGIIAAIFMILAKRFGKEREDSIIGAIWSIGMALGLLLISLTPGYQDPMSFLFGNILLISPQDLYRLMALMIIVLLIFIIHYRTILAFTFDEEFTQIRGKNIFILECLLLCIVAVSIVLLANIFGIILVIALLTLPAALAANYTGALKSMMLLTIVLCLLFNLAGLFISYYFNLPSGPTIILLTGIFYLIGLFGKKYVI